MNECIEQLVASEPIVNWVNISLVSITIQLEDDDDVGEGKEHHEEHDREDADTLGDCLDHANEGSE